MKAQRRHELQTNTLAEQMGEFIEYVQSKSQAILVALMAVVVIVVVAWYWQHSAQARRAEGWQTMLVLLSTSKQQDPQVLEKMEQVAGSYSDARLKAMAYAQIGNRMVDEAAVTEKAEAARSYVEKASAAFQAVLTQTPDQVVPAAIARLGLATIAADKGDYAAAQGYYEAVGKDDRLAGTPFPAQASAALTALEAARKLPALAPTTQSVEAAVPASQPAKE
jgi:hypothetical protein